MEARPRPHTRAFGRYIQALMRLEGKKLVKREHGLPYTHLQYVRKNTLGAARNGWVELQMKLAREKFTRSPQLFECLQTVQKIEAQEQAQQRAKREPTLF